jgi:hypothetical protein
MAKKRNRHSPEKNLDLAEKSLRKCIGYLAYSIDPEVEGMNQKVYDLVHTLALAGKDMEKLAYKMSCKSENVKIEAI